MAVVSCQSVAVAMDALTVPHPHNCTPALAEERITAEPAQRKGWRRRRRRRG